MNKSVSISLGGLSFFIEEDAFHKLQKYLEDVKSSLDTGEEDTAEILKDVETRIAELFKEWLGNYRQVIDIKDVDKMIGIMGTPEQYQSEGEEENASNHSSSNNNSSQSNGKFYQRQLFRDMDDKIIAGVCSGLSNFFGIQPIWVRLGVVVLFIFSGWILDGLVPTIIFIYIILWIVMPKATTTSDKLKMKGKPVNFDSIKEYINKEEISEQTGKVKKNISKASNGIGNLLESFFKVVLKIFAIFIGFIFVITGISIIIAYLVGSFSLSLESMNSLQFMNLIFDSLWELYTLVALAGIIVIIPSFFLILVGLRLITEKTILKITLTAIISIFVIWLISVIVTAVMSLTLIVSQFGDKAEKINKQEVVVTSDTLVVTMKDFDNESNIIHNKKFSINNIDNILFTENGIIRKINKDLKIKQSTDSNFYLVVKSIASGRGEQAAQKNVSNIQYKYKIDKNNLSLDSYLEMPKNSKYRNQDVELILFIPKGKYIQTHNIKGIIHKENGEVNIYRDSNGNPNKVFKFVENSLECLTCDENNGIYYEDNSDESINIDKDGIIIKSGKEKIKINKEGIKINKHGTDTL